eukprot:2424016-Pleurochrysis_carterae.AAC.1
MVDTGCSVAYLEAFKESALIGRKAAAFACLSFFGCRQPCLCLTFPVSSERQFDPLVPVASGCMVDTGCSVAYLEAFKKKLPWAESGRVCMSVRFGCRQPCLCLTFFPFRQNCVRAPV